MKIISYGHSFLRKLFAIDLRALALFRISVATVLITDLCIRFQDLTAHHSGQGVSPGTVPLSAFFQWPLRLHSLSGNEFFQGFLFFLALIFAIQLLLGYRTWRAVLLCWVFHLSLLSRNGMIMTGGDSFLRLMLFWSLFVPLGAKWSVDHALNEEASSENKSHLSIGSAGILVQVFCLYFFAALTKTGASWTEHFTAVNMATQIEYLTLPFGHLLYYFPMLTRPLSFFVYGLEFWGAWLLFFPWKTQRVRIFLVAAFTLLQVGFALSMRLGIFPLIASVGGILFLPGSFFEFLRSVCGGESLKDRSLVYQKDQTRNKRIVLIIREMLLLRSFSILSSEDYLETKQSLVEENRGWALACPGGQTATGFLALKGLVMASPLFSWWPSFFQLIVAAILWAMMPLMALGARIFKESRQRRCKWIRNLLMQIVALMALFFICYQNYQGTASTAHLAQESFAAERHIVEKSLNKFGQTFMLYQRWKMFAPNPPTRDGWVVALGELNDGRKVDLFRQGQPLSWIKPHNLAMEYPTYRWRKYLENQVKNDGNRGQYLDYLCRKSLQEGLPLKKVTFYHMREKANSAGKGEPVPFILAKKVCQRSFG